MGFEIDLQVERLVGQRGMTEEQARARMAAQATREQRLAIADIVIDNSGPLADLDRRVAEVWAELAGGGVAGGRIVGASDKIGGYPTSDPQTPENLAATIYRALGIPPAAAWHDEENRPHYVYRGEPIAGLS